MTINATDHGLVIGSDGVCFKSAFLDFDMRLAVNFQFLQYWAGGNYFANLCKGGSITSAGGTTGPDKYPIGDIVGTLTILLMEVWVYPGLYYVRWEGTATNVTLGGGVVRDDSPPPNELHFDVAGGVGASLDVNVSGGTLTKLEVFHESDLARINAGQIVSSLNIDAWTGSDTVRVVQATQSIASRVVDYSDLLPYDSLSWIGGIEQGYDDAYAGMPPRAACEFANELGADLWYNFPGKASDACVQSIWSELSAYLDNDKKVYAELALEVWNTIPPFLDDTYLFYRWEQPGGVASIDPNTGIVTDPGHSLINGDEVAFYRRAGTIPRFANGTALPEAPNDGAIWSVDSVTANTWRLRERPGGAPTFPLPVSEIYYKRHTGSLPDTDPGGLAYQHMREQYGARCLEVWNLADGLMARSRRVHLICSLQWGGALQAPTQYSLDMPGVAAACDGVAINPYMNIGFMGDVSDPSPYPSFDTATYAQIQEWSEWHADPANAGNWMSSDFTDLRAALDTYNPNIEMLAYECGNGFGHGGFTDNAKAQDWIRSTEGGQWIAWYFQMFADANFDMVTWYNSGGNWSAGSYFGMTPHPGEYLDGSNQTFEQGNPLIRQGGLNKTPP